ncbi:DUF3990 domain-containing protein [Breznakiellaceae bacterium SP9]
MRLYHGALLIVEQPHICCGPHSTATDFGPGFYTTTDEEQAEKWVRIKQERKQKEEGFVSIFEAPDDLLQRAPLKRLVFRAANRKWLEFVIKNRKQGDLTHDYDIVAGPLANDQVYAALSLYEQALLDTDETIRRLKTYTLVDQVLFATARSVKELLFIGGRQV